MRLTFGGNEMKRSTLAILVLVALLIGSNGWWFYQAMTSGVAAFYEERVLKQSLQQLSRVLSIVAQHKGTKDEIIELCEIELQSTASYEGDDIVTIGHLRLEFDKAGRLTSVVSDK